MTLKGLLKIIFNDSLRYLGHKCIWFESNYKLSPIGLISTNNRGLISRISVYFKFNFLRVFPSQLSMLVSKDHQGYNCELISRSVIATGLLVSQN